MGSCSLFWTLWIDDEAEVNFLKTRSLYGRFFFGFVRRFLWINWNFVVNWIWETVCFEYGGLERLSSLLETVFISIRENLRETGGIKAEQSGLDSFLMLESAQNLNFQCMNEFQGRLDSEACCTPIDCPKLLSKRQFSILGYFEKLFVL